MRAQPASLEPLRAELLALIDRVERTALAPVLANAAARDLGARLKWLEKQVWPRQPRARGLRGCALARLGAVWRGEAAV